MTRVDRLALEPGKIVVINGTEYIVKKLRGDFVEFEGGSEMRIIYKRAVAHYADDKGNVT